VLHTGEMSGALEWMYWFGAEWAAPFADRADAGRRLGERLESVCGEDAVVLGLPRGGVVVAFEVARRLDAPLDVIVVRKLGVPTRPELAMGAIGECRVRVINRDVVRRTRIGMEQIAAVEQRERDVLERRVARLRGGRAMPTLAGRTAIVVDDGIATGATASAACQVARVRAAAHVVMAAPVAAPTALDDVRRYADDVVCLETPDSFAGVGQWYADFTQNTDEEVSALLYRARGGSSGRGDTAPD